MGNNTTVELFGGYYAAYYSPLTVDGRVIGMLFTGINYDSVRADRQTMLDSVLLTAILAGLACALLTFLYGLFAIGRPLKKISAFADRIRSGDLGFSTPSSAGIDVRSSDEAGALARVLEQSYLQLRGYVGEIRERMQTLSDGDLVTESSYEFRGDFIMIKDAINGIIQNFNRIMGEVGGSSEQVSMAATHVADGAQLLAQGSTEQASTIETLSASISAINEQTGRNAGVAKEATVLSVSIRDSAEKGEQQMDRMMKAIGDINEASEKISKVISVIDDIAFQTNILALNAAVEAASAGQHGRGFAVVAAEVRRLAAKCAAAASDTNELIVDSVSKSNYGLEIATETSKSLKGIVDGINRSAAIVAQIAVSSEAQAKSIGDISDGIGHVAQVIQQNSAAAEESAAASQEMNAQSSLLLQLMSHFDIERAQGAGATPRALETGN